MTSPGDVVTAITEWAVTEASSVKGGTSALVSKPPDAALSPVSMTAAAIPPGGILHRILGTVFEAPYASWYLTTLGTLIVIAFIAYRVSSQKNGASTNGGTPLLVPPEFWAFQTNYLTVYLLCLFSDWLKGPYVYALYEQYGFSTEEIAWLFAGGFLSSLIVGTTVGSLSDKLGRKCMCLVFCIVYAASAVTKVIPNFWWLFFGRVLSGIATSLLFTVFESWMVTEHHARQFPEVLLTNTFYKQTVGNGVVAILAGFVAQIAASCCGYAAPFLVAIPCLLFAGLLILRWGENYGNRSVRLAESIWCGVTSIASDVRLQWLGLCQSLFEAAMYLWVFYWTPAVSKPEDKHLVPYGLLFASYMTALMIGGFISQHFTSATAASSSGGMMRLAAMMHVASAVSMGLAALEYDSKGIVFLCFTIFEGCVGVYFPCHGTLRALYVPDASRAAVMNVFRFPMNAMVIGLMVFKPEPRFAVGMLGVAHVVSLFALKRLQALTTISGLGGSGNGGSPGHDI